GLALGRDLGERTAIGLDRHAAAARLREVVQLDLRDRPGVELDRRATVAGLDRAAADAVQSIGDLRGRDRVGGPRAAAGARDALVRAEPVRRHDVHEAGPTVAELLLE